MTRLVITRDGSVRGLWEDGLSLGQLGRLSVWRASYVEFDVPTQQWCVRLARPRAWWRRLAQALLRRPYGEVAHRAALREQALAWERRHFGLQAR